MKPRAPYLNEVLPHIRAGRHVRLTGLRYGKNHVEAEATLSARAMLGEGVGA